MDQDKIGVFISDQRKMKGWTQSQLAKKLGVTDKAVSKWENGRSLPDLSLFPPLCSLLGITLNELFAGEKIPEENLKEKTDQILMEVIKNYLGYDKKIPEKAHTMDDSPSACNALKVCHVSKNYQTGPDAVLAVNDVSFQIPYGSFTGIMGASGSGKTTLLNLIATIDTPTSGEISVGGQCISALPEKDKAKFRRERLGFVFQEYNLLDTLTVYENIALALSLKNTAPHCKISETVQDLSKKLGITPVLDKFPYEISGGQKQRCACARAIAPNPDLILADEPTGALDSHAARALLDTFLMLRKDYGVTILMVTHDALSASYCDQILFMKNGKMETSLIRGEKSKQAFFTGILEKMAQIEGGDPYVS